MFNLVYRILYNVTGFTIRKFILFVIFCLALVSLADATVDDTTNLNLPAKPSLKLYSAGIGVSTGGDNFISGLSRDHFEDMSIGSLPDDFFDDAPDQELMRTIRWNNQFTYESQIYFQLGFKRKNSRSQIQIRGYSMKYHYQIASEYTIRPNNLLRIGGIQYFQDSYRLNWIHLNHFFEAASLCRNRILFFAKTGLNTGFSSNHEMRKIERTIRESWTIDDQNQITDYEMVTENEDLRTINYKKTRFLIGFNTGFGMEFRLFAKGKPILAVFGEYSAALNGQLIWKSRVMLKRYYQLSAGFRCFLRK